MEKRVRSPNYPAISLPAAIERVTTLYANQHTHAAPREVVAKNMGFQSLSGPSATVISALNKYGLLERSGSDIKISERALKILHPHSEEERAQAIQEAANEPQLFAALNERFPGMSPPNDELLRNYLIRSGFSTSAISAAILAYRETAELMERRASDHDSVVGKREARLEMPTSLSHVSTQSPSISQDTRSLGRYDFEGGGFVQIVAGGDIDTNQALTMAQILLDLKRKEIEMRTTIVAVSNLERSEESEGDPI